MKNIKAKLVASAMTIVMAGSLCACGGGGSYRGPVDELISLTNKKETDPTKWMFVMQPGFAEKEQKAYYDVMKDAVEDYEDELEDSKERYEDYFDECDDAFDGWKISFEESEAEKIDKDDLEDYMDEVEDYYDDYYKETVRNLEDVLEDKDDLEEFAENLDIDEKDAKKYIQAHIKYLQAFEDLEVTAGYEVKGKFILKTDDDDYKSDTVKLTVLKINGSWVYWGVNDSSKLGFDEDEDGVFNFFFNELRYGGF